jgi:mannose-6-phosphate isomerase-like protein (cupin superfamily)
MTTDGKAKPGKTSKAQELRKAPQPARAPHAKVMRMEEAFWEVPPGHSPGALSKMLVHPTNADTKHFDFRISSYQPRHYAEVHVHEVAENLYYVLQGKGIVELDGVRHVVAPHTVVHIPAGVRHGIFNTGIEDLIFIVVASPPYDMPEVKQTGGRES